MVMLFVIFSVWVLGGSGWNCGMCSSRNSVFNFISSVVSSLVCSVCGVCLFVVNCYYNLLEYGVFLWVKNSMKLKFVIVVIMIVIQFGVSVECVSIEWWWNVW